MKVDSLLLCGTHVHDRIISVGEEAWVHKIISTRHFLSKCMYQAMKGSKYLFCLFLWYFYHLVDTTAGGLLVTEDIIRLVVLFRYWHGLLYVFATEIYSS
jgi:hypothetical protein